jgi:HTH-type transcriptional regulator / antitoxin HigA
MQVRPIKSESDYRTAIRRIEALWGAPLATPEGDELEIPVTLAEAYERQHYPIDLPDPVEAIKFRLEQQGKDYRALIGIIGQTHPGITK